MKILLHFYQFHLLIDFYYFHQNTFVTAGQALVIPVLQNVESLFYLNSEEATAAEDTQTEADANYLYKTVTYTKQSVVDGLNATGEVPSASITQLDATLAGKIDKLSEEGVETFEAALIAV